MVVNKFRCKFTTFFLYMQDISEKYLYMSFFFSTFVADFVVWSKTGSYLGALRAVVAAIVTTSVRVNGEYSLMRVSLRVRFRSVCVR